jgi:hypothetical protein
MMSDEAFRFRLRPQIPKVAGTSAPLLVGGAVVLFPLAALDEVLTTKESGYTDNPSIKLAMIVTALLIAALVSIAVIWRGKFRLARNRETPGFFASVGQASICSALLLGVYQAGTWVPYLLHLDGLSVQDRVEGFELEVEGIILLQVALGGAASIFVGSIAGFLAWVYQFIPGSRE